MLAKEFVGRKWDQGQLVGRCGGQVGGGAQDEKRHEVDGAVTLEEITEEPNVPIRPPGNEQGA